MCQVQNIVTEIADSQVIASIPSFPNLIFSKCLNVSWSGTKASPFISICKKQINLYGEPMNW